MRSVVRIDRDPKIAARDRFIEINKGVQDGAIEYCLIKIDHGRWMGEAFLRQSFFLKTFLGGSLVCVAGKSQEYQIPAPGQAHFPRGRNAALACRRQKFLRVAFFIEEVPITTPKRFFFKKFFILSAKTGRVCFLIAKRTEFHKGAATAGGA